MAANEEYLDDLLKSIEEMGDFQGGTDTDDAAMDETEMKETMDALKNFGEDEEWKSSLDEILAAGDFDEEEPDETAQETGSFDADIHDEETSSAPYEDMDVTKMIDGMEDSSGDLAEINDLLKKADNNETLESDGPSEPAFEENGEDAVSSGENADEDLFALDDLLGYGEKTDSSADDFAEDGASAMDDSDVAAAVIEDKAQEKKKKKRKKRGKNKNQDADPDSLDSIREKGEGKKKGFISRLLETLTKEAEEEKPKKSPGDMQQEGEEGEEGASNKKNEKNVKKKKEKKEKKKSGKADKKAKKKPKKEKPKKEPKPSVPKEKSKPIIGKKALILLIAFCATILGSIILLTVFLTEFMDRQNAKNAFSDKNYEETYKLLYDRKLNQEEQQLFDSSSMVLQLQRRLDSYELNKNLGMEAEALDALLKGIRKFEEIQPEEALSQSPEALSLYQTILGYLSEDYGISEAEAMEINTYGDEHYSKTVYEIAEGLDFTGKGNGAAKAQEAEQEQEVPSLPQDILPEEEEIINLEP